MTDRHTLQAEGKHPAPCARFCEANAFRIELRQRDSYIEFLEARRNVLESLTATHDELLEALKEAENALADYIPTIERTGASLNYGHKVLNQARAAIARATHKE